MPENFAQAIRRALLKACTQDPSVLICGQLVHSGQTLGICNGVPEEQMLQFPVSEALMNGAALGLALAGRRPVMIHERMDFMMVGADALVNFIPAWPAKPLTILAIVGAGHGGQGPQQCKDFSPWFSMLDGWSVFRPCSPFEAHQCLLDAIFGEVPVLYAVKRAAMESAGEIAWPMPLDVRLIGASKRHEEQFHE